MPNLPRFFVSPERISGEQVALEPSQAQQISRVLRLRRGAHILVLDGSGAEYLVGLDQVTGSQATGSILQQRAAPGEPRLRLTLCQALLKGTRFELALQKGTELGVSAFVPLSCQRSEPGPPTLPRLARWRRIILEAAEQSERGRLPTLAAPTGLDQALKAPEGASLFLWEGQGGMGLKEGLRRVGPLLEKTPSLRLLVGPEGGFTPPEVALAQERGALLVTLGPRVLRAETAGLAAAAVILFALGEMEQIRPGGPTPGG